jgi:hypothetical protein
MTALDGGKDAAGVMRQLSLFIEPPVYVNCAREGAAFYESGEGWVRARYVGRIGYDDHWRLWQYDLEIYVTNEGTEAWYSNWVYLADHSPHRLSGHAA